MRFPLRPALVQARISAPSARAFDLSASSAGFVFGLAVARSLILSGSARSILVCGADKMSGITNYDDPSTAILFGDGAGAVLVEEGSDDGSGIVDVVLRSDGNGASFLRLPAGGSRKPGFPLSSSPVNQGDGMILSVGIVLFSPRYATAAVARSHLALDDRHRLRGSV